MCKDRVCTAAQSEWLYYLGAVRCKSLLVSWFFQLRSPCHLLARANNWLLTFVVSCPSSGFDGRFIDASS